MSAWILFQILLNCIVFFALAIMWFRSMRPAKDDPRMSRGLQILQSKIAVLEDLIDRTDQQGQTLMALMEAKAQDLKNRLIEAEAEIKKIEEARRKSVEVAKIFQEKIPHEELLQMQKSQKYVKAAKLANAGVAITEIAKQVDLSLGELEFVTKINKDELQFSEKDLPDWIERNEVLQNTPQPEQILRPKTQSQQLEDLGNRFRQALQPPTGGGLEEKLQTPLTKPSQPSRSTDQPAVKKVVFPKVQGVYKT
jgi:hypothetical protein